MADNIQLLDPGSLFSKKPVENIGLGLFSNIVFEEGQLILEELPFAYIHSTEYNHNYAFLKKKGLGIDAALLFKLISEKKVDLLSELRPNPGFYININTDTSSVILMEKLRNKLNRKFKTEISIEKITALYSTLRCNCIHSRPLINSDSVGVGLYGLCSLLNHSCEPNAKLVFNKNGNAILIALTEIQKGTMISIDYLGIGDDCCVHKRRARLLTHHFFLCQCEKCQREEKEMGPITETRCKNPTHIPSEIGNSLPNDPFIKSIIKELSTLRKPNEYDKYYEKYFIYWLELNDFYFSNKVSQVAIWGFKTFLCERLYLSKETRMKISSATISYCYYMISQTLDTVLDLKKRKLDISFYMSSWEICISAMAIIIHEKANQQDSKRDVAIEVLFYSIFSMVMKRLLLNRNLFLCISLYSSIDDKWILSVIDNVKGVLPESELLQFASEIKKLVNQDTEYIRKVKYLLSDKDPEYAEAITTLEKLVSDIDFNNKQEEKKKTT